MLFDEQLSRKPDNYPWAKEAMRAMWHNPWSDDKFTFHSDVNDFKILMTDQQREMTKRCLSAIAQVEVAVKTFWSKLGDNLPQPAMKDLGAVMAGIEVIHNVAYERLLNELDLNDVFEENMKLDIIQNRVKYLNKHTHRYYKDSKKQYVYALVLFTLFVENGSLFTQFLTINYLNRFHNMLKDTAQQVTYTSREETIHALSGMRIILDLQQEYPEIFDDEMFEKIRHETREFFKAESEIIDWQQAGYESENLSAEIAKNMLKDRLDKSLVQINIQPVFNDVDEELLEKVQWFEEDILAEVKTDFFHARPTEYSKNNRSFDEDDLY